MSGMEVFYGSYDISTGAEERAMFELGDEDERYDWEEENKVLLVEADGVLYEVTQIEDVDPEGFILRIDSSNKPRVLCMWYNGGAGIHEVLEQAIKRAAE